MPPATQERLDEVRKEAEKHKLELAALLAQERKKMEEDEKAHKEWYDNRKRGRGGRSRRIRSRRRTRRSRRR